MNAGTRPVALVTGAGTGIGAATAATLREAGYEVAICGRRVAPLESVAVRTGAVPFPCDLDDAAAVDALAEAVAQRFGRLDTLVLNAGITREGSFGALTDEDWNAMLQTNLVSAAGLTRRMLPALRESRGSIVGVASVAALRMNSAMSGYSASKAGLVAMIQSIAVEYAADGVRANAVCPGWVRTEMGDEELAGYARERGLSLPEAYASVAGLTPQARAAEPREIAGVIRFLASEEASFITGVALPVDGGSSISDLGALAL